MGMYSQYSKAVHQMNEDLDPDLVLLGALFIASILLTYVGIFFDIMLGGLLALVILDIAVGYPLYKRQGRISEIEKRLPDVLVHIATSLRAGGTIESALKEVAQARYGSLSKEMRKMLLRMKEGKTFDEAFSDFAKATESTIVERTAEVIISARKTGGGLTTALLSIADDIRDIHRIRKERIAKTTVQVLFLVVAADVVSPMIFGLITGVMQFLAKVAGSAAMPLFDAMVFYFKAYLMISAVFVSLAASLIREGNYNKTVIYAPFLLLVTYLIYMGVSSLAVRFFAGG